MRSNHQIEEISSRLGMRASVLVGLSFGALIYALLPQTLSAGPTFTKQPPPNETDGTTCPDREICQPPVQPFALNQKVDELIDRVNVGELPECDLPEAQSKREGSVHSCDYTEDLSGETGDLQVYADYVVIQGQWAVGYLSITLTKGDVNLDASGDNIACEDCKYRRSELNVVYYRANDNSFKRKTEQTRSRVADLIVVDYAYMSRVTSLPAIVKINKECVKKPHLFEGSVIDFKPPLQTSLRAFSLPFQQGEFPSIAIDQPSKMLRRQANQVMIKSELDNQGCLLESLEEKTCTIYKRRFPKPYVQEGQHGYVYPLPEWSAEPLKCEGSEHIADWEPSFSNPAVDAFDLLNKVGRNKDGEDSGAFIGRFRLPPPGTVK